MNAKTYRRAANIAEGVSVVLAAISIMGGAGTAALLSTDVAIPIAGGLSGVAAGAGLLCMAFRVVGRKFENKSRKHDRISVLARSKTNIIDVIVSKALADNNISDDEFESVVVEI